LAQNKLEELAAWLVCPHCRSKVHLHDREFWCENPECRRSYPIVRMGELDVPQMLIELATMRDPDTA